MRTVIGASLALALALAACASTTGILPVGPGTYTITERFAPIRGGSHTAKTDALTQANAYSAQQGKQLMSTNMNTGDRSFELVFKCVTADEAAASNYKVQTAPNIVIENRGRGSTSEGAHLEGSPSQPGASFFAPSLGLPQPVFHPSPRNSQGYLKH
jgi:hypothetical protein